MREWPTERDVSPSRVHRRCRPIPLGALENHRYLWIGKGVMRIATKGHLASPGCHGVRQGRSSESVAAPKGSE